MIKRQISNKTHKDPKVIIGGKVKVAKVGNMATTMMSVRIIGLGTTTARKITTRITLGTKDIELDLMFESLRLGMVEVI